MADLNLIMPMAGSGTRFEAEGFNVPKPLIDLNGKPFFYWSTQSVIKNIKINTIVFVVLQEHIHSHHIDSIIKSFYPEAEIVVIPHILPGAVLTAMEGIKAIRNDMPILINDCDHAFICKEFELYANNGFFPATNGALLTFTSDNPNYSYVEFENGRVIGTKEKSVVSNQAICGAYFFTNAETFTSAATSYLNNCDYSEFYISGLYNDMIRNNQLVKIFTVDEHIPFGTPAEFIAAQNDNRLSMI